MRRETKFSLCAMISGYTAILDDGNRIELVAKDQVLSMNIAGGYLVQHLIDDLATKIICGSY